MKKIFLSWDDIDNACFGIYRAIKGAEWAPDYVIGLTRGGLIPATILSHRFNCPLYPLKVSLRDFQDADFAITEKPRWMLDQEVKKVLIVDDINDSGNTINTIKKVWSGDWHNNIRFAVIVNNTASEATVDYKDTIINKNKEDVWIVYPWENQNEHC